MITVIFHTLGLMGPPFTPLVLFVCKVRIAFLAQIGKALWLSAELGAFGELAGWERGPSNEL